MYDKFKLLNSRGTIWASNRPLSNVARRLELASGFYDVKYMTILFLLFFFTSSIANIYQESGQTDNV